MLDNTDPLADHRDRAAKMAPHCALATMGRYLELARHYEVAAGMYSAQATEARAVAVVYLDRAEGRT
jgi:hypothetical protein